MEHLYGDSTPSPLKSNFLEYLRDALDFAVYVVQADGRIQEGRELMASLRREAGAETGRLQAFVDSIQGAIAEAPKGAPDSPTARCADQLAALGEEALASSTRALEEKLAEDIALAEAREKAEREACSRALQALLVPHEPHDASIVRTFELEPGGTYRARLVGAVGGIGYGLELVPAEHWSGPLRVERLIPELEIATPQVSGWISKEVKVRPQRIERYVVTKLVDDGDSLKFDLRAELGAAVGFDVDANPGTGRVKMSCVGPKESAATGPFEVAPDDAPKLVGLAEALRASAAASRRLRLVTASLDSEPFEGQPTFRPFLDRLVAQLAPVVHTITARSLTPTELVLRRMLGDDRREELFVAKSVLRDKYASLPQHEQAIFAPLGLHKQPPGEHAPEPPGAEPPAVRSELPRSTPPPPLKPPAPVVLPPPPPPGAGAASGVSAAGSAPSLVAPPPSRAIPPPVPPSRPGDAGAANGYKSPAIVAALKAIASLAQEGNLEEAYRHYAELFRSRPFKDAGADEQRQLGRLVMRANRPPSTAAVLDAYRALSLVLKALIEMHNEPADYELLGVVELAIGDPAAARQAFGAALERERVRNPGSELCESLKKRVGAS